MAENNEPRSNRLRRAIRERGSRLPPDVLRLLRAAAGEVDESMTHQECQDLLPEYVDAEIAGEDIASKYPQVMRHLDLCENCSGRYADLLELQSAESEGLVPVPSLVPDPGPVPPPVLSFPEFVRQKAAAILSALSPDRVQELESVANTFFRRIVPSGARFSLTFDAAKAMGFGPGELDTPLTILIVTFATTQTLVDSLSLDQINALAAQNLLGKKIEEYALQSAREFHISEKTAREIAEQFAAAVAADPSALRQLIEMKNN